VDESTAKRLSDINYQFYQTFAGAFSATRRRIQPGVRRLLEGFPPAADLLDLGCGNGELAFIRRELGHTGAYLGLDFSAGLIDSARQVEAGGPSIAFQTADLAAPDWIEQLAGRQFPIVVSFAALHHIPGQERRLSLLQQAAQALAPGGTLALSVWQFLDSPRMAERVQPWSLVDLPETALDPGDYLLDWRSGGRGLRYVHLFDENELAALAQAVGFSVVDTFRSDGENGRLGLYQVWKR
jgi:tRNA (uracil-5-)-methyltransferase TRM9